MLKIRFILLAGVLLGGVLSLAAIKGRAFAETKKPEASASREPSQAR